jgi:hypothetical protein
MAAAQAQAKPVVYEIDDLLIELPEDHPTLRYNVSRPGAGGDRAGRAVTCTTPTCVKSCGSITQTFGFCPITWTIAFGRCGLPSLLKDLTGQS